MRILQVSTSDFGGGAEKTAWKLHNAFRERGHESVLVVGMKLSDDPDVLAIDNSVASQKLGRVKTRLQNHLGLQYISFPGSKRIPELVGRSWDIAHLHNLHGNYFDVSAVRRLARQAPVILTLQDMWLLTGHCSHSLGCNRWRTGCGSCPDLTIYPAIRRDATRLNLVRKKRALGAGSLATSSPARWLSKMISQSYLSRFPHRTIPNSVDTRIFKPHDQRGAREELKLPLDQPVIFFPANAGPRNAFRDSGMFFRAIRDLADLRPLGVAFGDARGLPNDCGLRMFPATTDEALVARFYQAADVVVYPSLADTFPLAVLEALATARPIVATKIGGIQEIVVHGKTGFVVDPLDQGAFVGGIRQLLEHEDLRLKMGVHGAALAAKVYDLQSIVDRWLEWYEELREFYRNYRGSPG